MNEKLLKRSAEKGRRNVRNINTAPLLFSNETKCRKQRHKLSISTLNLSHLGRHVKQSFCNKWPKFTSKVIGHTISPFQNSNSRVGVVTRWALVGSFIPLFALSRHKTFFWQSSILFGTPKWVAISFIPEKYPYK